LLREEEKEEMEHKDKRIEYYDVLNVLAAICVVWIHFGNGFHYYSATTEWQWCLIIQVSCYWAVPVFFMLTGATLMDYPRKYSTREFFRRRIKRTLIPYLFFGVVALFWYGLLWNGGGWVEINWEHPVLSLLDIFINNRMESIYWFLPVLFGIYIAMPALSVFARPENRKQLDYLVCIGTLTISVFPFFAKMIQEFGGLSEYLWNSALEIPLLGGGGYILFPVLGYWASTHDFKRKERILCYLAAVSSFALRWWGLAFLSARDGATNQLFMDYCGFPSAFLAMGVFVFIKTLCQSHPLPEKMRRFLQGLSSCSFGVYLIHWYIITAMTIPFFLDPFVRFCFVWPPLCYIFCAMLVYGGKKVWSRICGIVNKQNTRM